MVPPEVVLSANGSRSLLCFRLSPLGKAAGPWARPLSRKETAPTGRMSSWGLRGSLVRLRLYRRTAKASQARLRFR